MKTKLLVVLCSLGILAGCNTMYDCDSCGPPSSCGSCFSSNPYTSSCGTCRSGAVVTTTRYQAGCCPSGSCLVASCSSSGSCSNKYGPYANTYNSNSCVQQPCYQRGNCNEYNNFCNMYCNVSGGEFYNKESLCH